MGFIHSPEAEISPSTFRRLETPIVLEEAQAWPTASGPIRIRGPTDRPVFLQVNDSVIGASRVYLGFSTGTSGTYAAKHTSTAGFQIANFLLVQTASFSMTGTPILNGTATNLIVLGGGASLSGSMDYLAKNQNTVPARLVTVVGLVNSAGICVGSPPQVVYDGTPSVEGEVGSETWDAFSVPLVGGTYRLRFQTFLNMDPTLCISHFRTNPPVVETGGMQGVICTVVVPAACPWTLWWQHTSGLPALWQMDGTNACSFQQSRVGAGPVSPGWNVVGTADFDANGSVDLLWQHTNGSVALWLLDATNCLKQTLIGNATAGAGWRVGATGDLDGDGHTDVLWQHTSGATAVWFMNGTNFIAASKLNAPIVSSGWRMVGTADINRDGNLDILWQNTIGATGVWFMNGTNWVSSALLNAPPAGVGWRVVGTADLFQQGHADLLWQHDRGAIAYWVMDGTNHVSAGWLNPGQVDPSWRIVGPK
jgi:hypothetical protein